MDRIERVRASVRTQLDEIERKAHAAFKRGTTPTDPEADEQLSRALGLYEALIRADPSRRMPMLLAIHAALAKEQITRAERALMSLAVQHPNVFLERPDISSHFGDPTVLSQQMVQFMRIGDTWGDDLQAYALQAYCAWVLNDTARLRRALQRIRELSREHFSDERVRRVEYALRVALDQSRIAGAKESATHNP